MPPARKFPPMRRRMPPRKGRFARRAGIAALALGTAIGSHSMARAQEARADSLARPDSAKTRFVPSAADWRGYLGALPVGLPGTFLVDRKIPVYLDFSRAKGSSTLGMLALAGKGGIGMHLLFSKELEAKDVPTFVHFGLKGKVGPMIVGLSGVKEKERFEPEVSADYGIGSFGIRGHKMIRPGEPIRLGVRAFREIGASRLAAFLQANLSRNAFPKGGISFDRGTRAFDLSIGPKNEKAVAIIQSIGENKYVSLIYSHGAEKRLTLEFFIVH